MVVHWWKHEYFVHTCYLCFGGSICRRGKTVSYSKLDINWMQEGNRIEWERRIGHVNGYNVQGTIIMRGINDGNTTEYEISVLFPSFLLVINYGQRTALMCSLISYPCQLRFFVRVIPDTPHPPLWCQYAHIYD